MSGGRIGLFGGSFNPIHNGHLHLAQCGKEALNLQKVVLIPTGEAPHKDCSDYAPANDRLNMCRLAAMGKDWLQVSDIEVTREGRSYTVETLRILHERYPAGDWVLLLGSDMLLTFDEWYCYEEILTLTAICAMSRVGDDYAQLLEARRKLLQAVPQAEITVLQTAAYPMSSTKIRENFRNGANNTCNLPENVVQYIGTHQLYRARKGEEDGEAYLE